MTCSRLWISRFRLPGGAKLGVGPHDALPCSALSMNVHRVGDTPGLVHRGRVGLAALSLAIAFAVGSGVRGWLSRYEHGSLSDEEGRRLQQVVRRGKHESIRVRRVLIIMASASGPPVPAIPPGRGA
jgi:hypothetical protein